MKRPAAHSTGALRALLPGAAGLLIALAAAAQPLLWLPHLLPAPDTGERAETVGEEAPDRAGERAVEAVKSTCERIGGKLGSVSARDCRNRGLALSGAASVNGTPILVKDYGPVAPRDPLGRVFLFGGIHGDEFSSVSVVFKWMEILEQDHSGLFHWRIAPLVNPDGLLRDKSQRMNENGVDLNRNFPTPNWLIESHDYWVRRAKRNARRYPGPAPLSEPESRYLAEEIERFRPSAIVAVHAPVNVVDFDGPSEPPPRLGPLYLKLMGTYPGSLGRYAGVHMGLPVVTIELPHAGIMPTLDEQATIWADLLEWLEQNLRAAPGAPTAIVAGAAR